ncbi:MAG: ABC transporter ATP-binding protein/permease [Chromatiales bacterium]|jgi:ATP-binding cassette subfamily C protein|nr:ABC transporter ATP-binding protein/permease [Chromatiales bacterium]
MVLFTFTRAYPWQSLLMIVALLLAGLAEGSSMSILLPLLSIAVESVPGAEQAQQSEFAQMITGSLQRLGITPNVGSLLVVGVVGIVIKSALLLVADRQVGYTKARVTTDLRLRLLRAVMSSRWDYFVHQPIGRLTNSMATEAWRASIAYEFGVGIIAYGLQAIIYGVVAFMVSWQATLASLGAGLVILFLSHFLVKMTRKAGKRQTNLLKSLLARMTDTLNSVKTMKAMGRENLADGVLQTETSRLNQALEKEVFSKAVLSAAQEPMFAIVIAVGMFVLLQRWQMPIAEVLVLVLVLTRVLLHLGKIQKHYQKMVAAESAYWSMLEAVQEADAKREEYSGVAPPPLDTSIELSGVGFSYDGVPLLRDVDMTIPAGALTTIIGQSGSGKTTILDLIAGLHRPESGALNVDGVSLATVDLRKWRRQIGYAPQEAILLHDSILNNITLGDPALSEEDARVALEKADAWAFVDEMEDGLETSVGERGARISSGQRQRIMLARALVHRPRLLILDEATSALDRASEEAICNTLKSLCGELTIVAVSHQPALADFADVVYRMSQGTVEGGPDATAPGTTRTAVS